VIENARRQKETSLTRNNSGATTDFSVDPQLKKIFVKDAEKAISELEAIYEKRNAWESDDIQMYVVNVHAMKSALANIG
jgi:hypothetical protein